MNSKIADLEEDLTAAQAQGATNSAGVVLEHKKEVEKLTSKYTKDLSVKEKQIEKLQK